MKILYEEFDGLGRYLETIGARKPNKVFENRSLSSNDDDYSFTLTHSYSEAQALAANGYKEGLDRLREAKIGPKHLESAPKPLPVNGIVGYAPHVPNAITGIPISMINRQEIEQKSKVISILYYMGGSCGVDARNFVEAGKNVMNVIYSLELKGYRVALYVMTTFCKSDEYAINAVQIKNWRQPSNPLKISYPLIHPSFFRRHGFRWLETVPELENRGFPNGYGRPLDNMQGRDTDARRQWLTEKGILKQGWFYTERYEAQNYEAEELIKRMGVESGKTFGTPEKKKRPAAAPYNPRKAYEPERGMGLRLEDMGLLPPAEYEADGEPDFTAEDLALTAEELYRKKLKKEFGKRLGGGMGRMY